jgi:hypothetical protein
MFVNPLADQLFAKAPIKFNANPTTIATIANGRLGNQHLQTLWDINFGNPIGKSTLIPPPKTQTLTFPKLTNAKPPWHINLLQTLPWYLNFCKSPARSTSETPCCIALCKSTFANPLGPMNFHANPFLVSTFAKDRLEISICNTHWEIYL